MINQTCFLESNDKIHLILKIKENQKQITILILSKKYIKKKNFFMEMHSIEYNKE